MRCLPGARRCVHAALAPMGHLLEIHQETKAAFPPNIQFTDRSDFKSLLR